ncbi:hypothetical protein [Brevibacillus agri]|uniref:hypothetical protein n=1 Tax=Brevibacillus agri TaxID=51101 RepID=UPI002E1B0B84|nr:hypothetical protein [Brevibacillus agri]
MVDRAKYGDNEALLKVIEEMKTEIESLAGFLKLSRQEGIQEITGISLESSIMWHQSKKNHIAMMLLAQNIKSFFIIFPPDKVTP